MQGARGDIRIVTIGQHDHRALATGGVATHQHQGVQPVALAQPAGEEDQVEAALVQTVAQPGDRRDLVQNCWQPCLSADPANATAIKFAVIKDHRVNRGFSQPWVQRLPVSL